VALRRGWLTGEKSGLAELGGIAPRTMSPARSSMGVSQRQISGGPQLLQPSASSVTSSGARAKPRKFGQGGQVPCWLSARGLGLRRWQEPHQGGAGFGDLWFVHTRLGDLDQDPFGISLSSPIGPAPSHFLLCKRSAKKSP